jgi:hypothetical protein
MQLKRILIHDFAVLMVLFGYEKAFLDRQVGASDIFSATKNVMRWMGLLLSTGS